MLLLLFDASQKWNGELRSPSIYCDRPIFLSIASQLNLDWVIPIAAGKKVSPQSLLDLSGGAVKQSFKPALLAITKAKLWRHAQCEKYGFE